MPLHPFEFLKKLDFNEKKVQDFIRREVLHRILLETYRYELPKLVEKDISNVMFTEDYLVYLDEMIIGNAELQLNRVMDVHNLQSDVEIKQLEFCVNTAQIGIDLARGRLKRYHRDLKIDKSALPSPTRRSEYWSGPKAERINNNTLGLTFFDLWNKDLSWLAKCSGYVNTKYVTEEERRAKLDLAVLRIGDFRPIVEFLEWLIHVNYFDTLFQQASMRWESDKDWLIAKYL